MFRFFRKSPHWVDAVIRLLDEDPHGWTFGQYTVTHTRTGFVLWLRNHPYADMTAHLHGDLNPGRFHAIRLRRAVRRTLAAQLFKALSQKQLSEQDQEQQQP